MRMADQGTARIDPIYALNFIEDKLHEEDGHILVSRASKDEQAKL